MYKKRQAKNGLTMIVSPMGQMASVSLGIWIGVGGRYEAAEKSGISHLVEHMLFKGTHSRSTKELKEGIEGVGGSFNGFTSDEVTCYLVKVPAKYLELGIDILADMVLNAKFDAKDVAKEKYVVCEEIKMYRDQPAEHVMDLLRGIMWPGNALGRPLTGNMTTVKSFTRDEIVKFKEKSYHPGNIGVVAAGKVDTEKFFSYAAEKFAGRQKKGNLIFEAPAIRQKSPVLKFQHGDVQQTHIAMGFHMGKQNLRERFSTKMMNVILGGNMSSRLFEELREKYGLCYDISSSYKRHHDVGEMVIHSGVDNRNTFKAVVAILDELKKIRDLGVTEDELTRAKEYTKGQFLLALEATSARMLWLGDRYMVYRDIPEIKDVLRRIDDVTMSGVKRSCESIFRAASISMAMIGNIRQSEKNKVAKEVGKL